MNTSSSLFQSFGLSTSTRNALPFLTQPGIELIDTDQQTLRSSPELSVHLAEALLTRFPLAVITMTMDLSIEAEAFGCLLRYHKDEVPSVAAPLFASVEEAISLQTPTIEHPTITSRLQAGRLLRDRFQGTPVLGGCIGPVSLAGRIVDMTELITGMYTAPEQVADVLEKCTQFLTEQAIALKLSGVNGLIVAEPLAGTLSAELCRRFSSDYVRSIVAAVQDENFHVILHNCGAGPEHVAVMAETGAHALHFGAPCPPNIALARVGVSTTVLGNIDPARILYGGSPEIVHREVTALLESVREFDNFILSSGCDIPMKTPLQNLDAFFDALNDFNVRNVPRS